MWPKRSQQVHLQVGFLFLNRHDSLSCMEKVKKPSRGKWMESQYNIWLSTGN